MHRERGAMQKEGLASLAASARRSMGKKKQEKKGVLLTV
jgi:hypothetical protein